MAAALATLVVGGLTLLIVAHLRTRSADVRTGAVPVGFVAGISRDRAACQRNFPLAGERVNRVAFVAQPVGSRATVEVTVRPAGGAATIARGRVSFATDPSGSRVAAIPSIHRDGPVDVCFRAVGPAEVALFGEGADNRVPGNSFTELTVGGQPATGDMVLAFERAEPRSDLSLLPAAFERAARWRPGWVGAWTYWVLLALAGVGAPFALVRALLSSVEEDPAEPSEG